MAVVEMTKRNFFVPGFHYTETIADGTTGDDVRIPPIGQEGGRITCTLIAGANTGKFQFTTSSDAAVTAGTATWQDWAETTNTGTVSDALSAPVTGIRGVSTSGEIKIEIVM